MSLNDEELREKTESLCKALTEMGVTDKKDRARVLGTAYTEEIPSRISEGGTAPNSVAAVQRYLFTISHRRIR